MNLSGILIVNYLAQNLLSKIEKDSENKFDMHALHLKDDVTTYSVKKKIMKSTIMDNLSDILGLMVVTEGVETEEPLFVSLKY